MNIPIFRIAANRTFLFGAYIVHQYKMSIDPNVLFIHMVYIAILYNIVFSIFYE